ncbi:MAG: hypothetical protein R2856_26700 [Caldilineaceae bacterium]
MTTLPTDALLVALKVKVIRRQHPAPAQDRLSAFELSAAGLIDPLVKRHVGGQPYR